MTIQFLSDLHLEFESNAEHLRQMRPQAAGDVLVVAGDSFYLGDKAAMQSDFWRWAADNFRQVMLIPGNHEYYGGYDMLANGESWECMFMDNVGYYQNKVVTIGDTDFILSTLWSHISDENRRPVNYFLNDFHRISYCGRPFTPDDYNLEHDRCLRFVRHAVSTSKARHRVVVTHHLPTMLTVPPKLKQIRGGTLLGAFATDLTEYIRSADIDCWIYGHSHVNLTAVIGGTKVISNQMGYVFKGETEWNNFRFSRHVTL